MSVNAGWGAILCFGMEAAVLHGKQGGASALPGKEKEQWA